MQLSRTFRTLLLTCASVVALAGCGSKGDSSSTAKSREHTAAHTSTKSTAHTTSAAESALHRVLLTAYTGASDFARTNGNYYARNDAERGRLGAAISTELSHKDTHAGSDMAKADADLDRCTKYAGDPMVHALVTGARGDGITLAAADDHIVVRLTYVAGGKLQGGAPKPCTPIRSTS